MKFFAVSCVLFALSLTVQGEDRCQDHSEWCGYLTRYGACNFNEGSRTACPRSCGICSVNCERVRLVDRVDCGFYGIDEKECFRRGCCWDSSAGPNSIWCHQPRGA